MALPRLVLMLVALVGLVSPVQAHISMTSPRPRSESQKVGPCGAANSTRGDRVSVYQPGETITVTWDEVVDHVGHYRIALDLDGNDDFPLPNLPNDNFATTLVDQIPDRSGGGGYGQEVTLPDVECDNCTLQLIQVMTTAVPYNSFYFQCADIQLSRTLPGSPDADVSNVGEPAGNCACAAQTPQSSWSSLLLLLGVAAYLRRQARASRPTWQSTEIKDKKMLSPG